MDEKEAIASLKRGEAGAMELLVRQYQVQALRTAYFITRDRALAEDVVQTSFLRVYEQINKYEERGNFGAWFGRIVANNALKALAGQEKRVSLERFNREEDTSFEILASRDLGPEELLLRAENRQAMTEIVNKLTPLQRSAIVLRYYLGLDEAAMAERLACPPGTVKRRLHDARERLRTLLTWANA